jgi:hypothetical protein
MIRGVGSRRGRVCRWGSALLLLITASCGGGGASNPNPSPAHSATSGSNPNPSPKYSATSGVAQKGPLILGSTVTAQELNASLSPTGKQYSYQITSDLGTFSPTSTFGSQYIGLNATGYYFDEIQNQVSTGPITLNGYNDLTAESVLNVNLLTTLAYQRIEKLVTSGMTFAAAQTQAENEVLQALNIPNGSQYGAFGTLDISKGTDGDHILAAISSVFLYGNSAGALSQLIANFQSDIGAHGVITNPATESALVAASKAVSPATVAANLSQKYSSQGLSLTPTESGCELLNGGRVGCAAGDSCDPPDFAGITASRSGPERSCFDSRTTRGFARVAVGTVPSAMRQMARNKHAVRVAFIVSFS